MESTESAAARRAIRLAARFDDDRQLRARAMYLARLVAEGTASDHACRLALAEMVSRWPDNRFRAWAGNRDIAEEARHRIMSAIMSPTVFVWERCAPGIVAWIATIGRRAAFKVCEADTQRAERVVLVDTQIPFASDIRVGGRRRVVLAEEDFADAFVERVNSEFDLSQALSPSACLDERCQAFCELFDLPRPGKVAHFQSRAARRLLRSHGSAKALMRRFLADELRNEDERMLFAAFADHGWEIWERVARITLHLDDAYADAAWASLTYPGRKRAAS